MSKRLLTLFPLAAFILLCVFLWRGLSLEPKKIPSNLINQPLPKIDLVNETNANFSNKDFNHEVSLLHVFASWCITCRAEHEYLMSFTNEKLNLYGLVFRDRADNINRWLQDFGNPYKQVLYDPKGDTILALGVYGTPETFIIDKKGVIRYKQVGEINQRNWPKIHNLILQLEDES